MKFCIAKMVVLLMTLAGLSAAMAEVENPMEVQFKAKLAEELKACQEEKSHILGIQELDIKYPGALNIKGVLDRLENIDELPDQDMLPTRGEIKNLLASIRIEYKYRERTKELIRPLFTPAMIAYQEAKMYLIEGKNLLLLTGETPYRQINLARKLTNISATKSYTEGMEEIVKQLKIGTLISAKEIQKIAKDAEAELFAFIEQYDEDVKKKKANGYDHCEKVGAYEVCTK